MITYEQEQILRITCKLNGLTYYKDVKGMYHHLGDFDPTSAPEVAEVIAKLSGGHFSYAEYLDALKRLRAIKKSWDEGLL